MVEILDKKSCCGCAACVQVCPKQCISFDKDNHGFRYPLVDKKRCVDCHLCENVCPYIKQGETRKPLHVYAAINPDAIIRKQSSSGGIFTMIAEKIIDQEGVVFGVRYDDRWNVIHDYVESKDALVALRGSKYVQSEIGNCYKKVKEYLKDGRKVLFSGTPCQVAGLKNFLRLEYDNLLTIDVACHGVPSPKVWKSYLNDYLLSRLKKQEITIKDINFRHKITGWKNYSFVITDTQNSDSVTSKFVFKQIHNKNPYMISFIRNLCLRESCFNCPAKSGKSGSDITLADYWGVKMVSPLLDDDFGTSLVMVGTPKGLQMIESLELDKTETTYEEGVRYNSSIHRCPSPNRLYESFWEQFEKFGFLKAVSVIKKTEPSPFEKMFQFITSFIKKVIRFVYGNR